MQEKRRHRRFKVSRSSIKGRMLLANRLEIDNISLNGVSLKADRRLEIGRSYQFKLEYQNKVLPVSGVVVWSMLNELSETPDGEMVPVYQAGLRFRDAINGETMGVIINFAREK